ncbi:hypothetical protein H2279_01645 [Campylobacter sp. B0100352/1]|uniref:hypothetical protein n=1 Tax=Campylobacter sp. B0100352/1 TaxID=2735783 RepID=UPI001D5B33B3|nr:hypothetical protein [Campylobacter sp. B0100352/1]
MEDRQKIARNVKIFAFASLIFGALGGLIPLLSIVSWILYIIVLYKLKVHAGAKKLFINFFSMVGIGFFGGIIVGILLYGVHEQGTIIVVEILLWIISLAVSYIFAKNMFYEIARVTHQKYFIKAFYTGFIGILVFVVDAGIVLILGLNGNESIFILTIISILVFVGIVLLIISCIYYVLAWIKFKSFDEEIEINNIENQIDLNSKK